MRCRGCRNAVAGSLRQRERRILQGIERGYPPLSPLSHTPPVLLSSSPKDAARHPLSLTGKGGVATAWGIPRRALVHGADAVATDLRQRLRQRGGGARTGPRLALPVAHHETVCVGARESRARVPDGTGDGRRVRVMHRRVVALVNTNAAVPRATRGEGGSESLDGAHGRTGADKRFFFDASLERGTPVPTHLPGISIQAATVSCFGASTSRATLLTRRRLATRLSYLSHATSSAGVPERRVREGHAASSAQLHLPVPRTTTQAATISCFSASASCATLLTRGPVDRWSFVCAPRNVECRWARAGRSGVSRSEQRTTSSRPQEPQTTSAATGTL